MITSVPYEYYYRRGGKYYFRKKEEVMRINLSDSGLKLNEEALMKLKKGQIYFIEILTK